MQSHLGPSDEGSNIYDARTADRENGAEAAGLERTPHGRVVRSSQVAQHVGGSRGNLEGAPAMPNQRMVTEVGLPAEAAHWRGSDAHFSEQELPHNDWLGSGFSGSAVQVSAAQLDDMDKSHGTSVKPLQPGAYRNPDGSILLVYPDGKRAVVSEQQYQQMLAQGRQQRQQAPASGGLLGRVVRGLRGG